ncbi:MAG: polyprenyl synthetase family protein [Bacilli bacterium]|nr:polyprenyl synthetase family protein [Bacilli bacterium]
MSIEAFKKFYKEEKNILNDKLNEFNNKLVIEDNLFIKENLEYFKNLNSDGKLIRGCLVNLGYYLLKDNKEYSNDLALAYEVFQTAILVHDDIIDHDTLRRGKDTIHFANYKVYNEYSDDSEEIINLTNSIALCIGDYGLYSANKIISEAYAKDKNLAKILNCFNDTVLNTIKGELLDVILPFRSKNTNIDQKTINNSVMEIYRLKTAYYTIIGPLSVGMMLAGSNDKKIKEISKFAERVGIAFQIQDDILGIYSDQIGKVVGSDIKEFKQTILYSYIIKTEYKDELLKYYGKNELDDKVIKRVRELFEVSGALKYAKDIMNKYYDEAIDILNDINWIDLDKKKILQGFVEYLRERNK